jgi:periplasmic copper chaperone A
MTLLIAAAAAFAPAAASAPVIHVGGHAQAGLRNSAAYLDIHNGGAVADRLLSVSSPAAASVSVHRTSNAGGVSRMRAAGALALAPGQRLVMKPGGLHVMLTGLKAPLRTGSRLPLSLRFAKAGAVRVSLPVVAPGAAPAGGMHHGH